MPNIEKTPTDSQIDNTINGLDRVMNGCEPGDDVPPFMADCMVEMRAIIRKLLDAGGTRPGVDLTMAHPSLA